MKTAIIGGGISGLALAYLLIKQSPSMEVAVFEEGEQAGGKILTIKKEGYLLEGAVNGFLNNRPKTLELAAMLGIAPLASNDRARMRYIYTKGSLKRIPESPAAFLKSDLLTLSGKLRLLYETFTPRGSEQDETLEHFAVRRLGREAFETLIDPMASGIYAGDPSKLSLQSCFKKIDALERKYGSLIRGMINMKLKAGKKGAKKIQAGPGGVLTSFATGMQEMVNALTAALGNRVHCSHRALSIEKIQDGYRVLFHSGETYEAQALVLATPAYASAALVKDIDRSLSGALNNIPYPAVTVVCTGFVEEALKTPFEGFGFLVPFKEGRTILGVLGDSNIFASRAPQGRILLRTMVGGARASHIAMEPDEKIQAMVLKELDHILCLAKEPEMVHIFRYEKAIPQYNTGHREILKKLSLLLENHPGLYLHGNSYEGIGVNDCIEHSFALSQRLV